MDRETAVKENQTEEQEEDTIQKLEKQVRELQSDKRVMKKKEKAFLSELCIIYNLETIGELKTDLESFSQLKMQLENSMRNEENFKKFKNEIKVLEDLNKEKIDNVVKLTQEREIFKKENLHLKSEINKYESIINKLQKCGIYLPNSNNERFNAKKSQQEIVVKEETLSRYSKTINTVEDEQNSCVVKFTPEKNKEGI